MCIYTPIFHLNYLNLLLKKQLKFIIMRTISLSKNENNLNSIQ